MKVLGVSYANVERAVFRASRDNYNDNLIIKDISPLARSGMSVQVSLRVKDSHGPGAHRSVNLWAGSERRTVAACWHAYRDVMHNLFEINPSARIRTALAKYDGAEDFAEKYQRTRYRETMMGTVEYGACDCEED